MNESGCLRILVIFAFMTMMSIVALALSTSAVTVYDPPPSKWDRRITELDRQAVEAAYAEQIRQLFSVWMKDARDQPDRAINGARQARRAYIAAMTEIEKREAK